VVSHRGGVPPSTAQQISLSEVITWVAAGCCSAVLASIASAMVGLVLHQGGIGLLVLGGVYISVGLAASRRGWRQVASFVAGIAVTYVFVLGAFALILSQV
jgi:hypothetical protein